MRSIRCRALAGAVGTLALVLVACSKEHLATHDTLPLLSPASLDANAGSWTMIVLPSPASIPVPAPEATNSSAYQAEVRAVIAAQATITKTQRDAVHFWGGGGVLRWNEIARGLAARFDLPPAPRADGTYPVPSAANPTADPQFPFSNPPYAVRAYSYVSVAQFEALKVAWYYKFLYNRPAPALVDPTVQKLIDVSALPAYPNEDAVLAGVTAALLQLFYPVAAAEIAQEASDQQTFALLSGKATASDIAAGLALGKAVAATFAARAASDGMKNAGGTPAIWKAFADDAAARGEIPWRSLEVPPRPPQLPLFGKVMAWLLNPADVVNLRPGPPPSTSSAQMAAETAEVKRAVEDITRDQLATVYKWADGVSTWSPPGHWNFIAFPFLRDARFSEVRAARAYALLNIAEHDACVCCWDAKFTYFNPRPSQLDPSIRTVVGLPNFPAYVSGHSTFSAAAAEVLSYLFPSGASYFAQEKEEAALSRLFGGIHYRSDIDAGKTLGAAVSVFTLNYARTDGAD